MSEPEFLRFKLPEDRIRAMVRGDRDFVVCVTAEGQVSAVCKMCNKSLEILRDGALVWFRCNKCALVSFYPVANVQRDLQFAIKDGQPFLSDLFYMRQLPATLKSPFAASSRGGV
jgi:hypothetical protein